MNEKTFTMSKSQTDIETRADIVEIVNQFYSKVKSDPLLGPHFNHLDWVKHLPVMYSFWSSMILGEQSYKANPFEKHINLPIQREHFDQWLKLFIQTISEHFEGARAEEIKVRATSIAGIFQYKMGLTPASK